MTAGDVQLTAGPGWRLRSGQGAAGAIEAGAGDPDTARGRAGGRQAGQPGLGDGEAVPRPGRHGLGNQTRDEEDDRRWLTATNWMACPN